ncbi:hypothetical protein K435DRAFT_736252, partial [Dendrothele bispora CBS 962.96]
FWTKCAAGACRQGTFTALSWDHFEAHGKPFVIGVDASAWFYRIQNALSASGSHSQLGSNPELAAVFSKL